MMTSHGKLRREKGSLAEYDSQVKGKTLVSVYVHAPLLHSVRVCLGMQDSTCAFMHECVWLLCTVIQTYTLAEHIGAYVCVYVLNKHTVKKSHRSRKRLFGA